MLRAICRSVFLTEQIREALAMMSKDGPAASQGTYDGFVSLMKWGTIACLVVTSFVVLIIS